MLGCLPASPRSRISELTLNGLYLNFRYRSLAGVYMVYLPILLYIVLVVLAHYLYHWHRLGHNFLKKIDIYLVHLSVEGEYYIAYLNTLFNQTHYIKSWLLVFMINCDSSNKYKSFRMYTYAIMDVFFYFYTCHIIHVTWLIYADFLKKLLHTQKDN